MNYRESFDAEHPPARDGVASPEGRTGKRPSGPFW
jgi:hypothetical protein